MKKQKKSIGYIIPHTHWDREWRYPIWQTRALLVEFMDQLLEIFKTNKDYRCFLLDGQCAPIEDYLEVRPEKKEQISKYVKEGRLAIGPWYTLPDLYPLDGECLVRNLLKGMRVAEQFGKYLKVGYNTFGWGQIAQFPQIYKEFGFDFIVAAKKVSKERAPQSEFIWESPDGTRILTTRLGEMARANFFLNVYIPTRFGVNYFNNEFIFKPSIVGTATHQANSEKCYQDYFVIKSNDFYSQDNLKECMEKAWKATEETTVKDHRLFLSGCDFSTPQPDLTKIIDTLNTFFEDKKFVHSTLEEYVDVLKKNINLSELKTVKGELRDGPPCFCSANALASRITLKQLNKKLQNIILHKTEPLASVLGMMGGEYPQGFLDLAWKYILQAHPHDSINGVTQDKTVEDTVNRLNQAIEIADVIYEKMTSEIIKRIDFSKFDENDNVLVVFNPHPKAASDIIEVCIDTPREWNAWDIKLTDENGNITDIQNVSRQEIVIPVHDLNSRPWPYYADRHIQYIDSGKIPALGYKIYKVSLAKDFIRDAMVWPPMRESFGNEISQSFNTLENEYLKAKINSNGTIDLQNKITGDEYENLNYFEDTGDIGDYWTYYPPYDNRICNSLGSSANIWCKENGPLCATLGVEIKMTIPINASRPEYGIRGESKRSDVTTEFIIKSLITLKKGSKKLDIKTIIDNTSEDHRLRVLFPSDIKAEFSYAAGHFTVDKRSVIPQKNSEGSFYPEMQTLPQQTFVDISDGSRGMALLNNCLTEYEILTDEYSTVALTLFRSVRNIICTDLRNEAYFPQQKGGQCGGKLEFEYSIYPHSGNWQDGMVYSQAEKLNISLNAVQTTAHKNGNLENHINFFEIQPESLVLSAFKKAQDRDSYIVRFFNPTNEDINGQIVTGISIKNAFLTDLNETRKDELKVEHSTNILINAKSNKIITVELVV